MRAFLKGALAVLPLTLAVIPWGILTGSFALDAGLDIFQSQAMSLFVFAGSAQLVSLGLIKAGVGMTSILLTSLLITSRHFLYSMAMREQIVKLPLRWRLTLGFLLTDELFAIANRSKCPKLDPWYALGGGLSFYLGWNIATAIGIFAGHRVENLDGLGLDFAIAATFIAIVVPTIKQASYFVCALASLVCVLICELFDIPGALMIATLTGMSCGYLYSTMTKELRSEH